MNSTEQKQHKNEQTKITRHKSLAENMNKTSAFLYYGMTHIKENKYYCTYSHLSPLRKPGMQEETNIKYLQFSNLNAFILKKKNSLSGPKSNQQWTATGPQLCFWLATIVLYCIPNVNHLSVTTAKQKDKKWDTLLSVSLRQLLVTVHSENYIP